MAMALLAQGRELFLQGKGQPHGCGGIAGGDVYDWRTPGAVFGSRVRLSQLSSSELIVVENFFEELKARVGS